MKRREQARPPAHAEFVVCGYSTFVTMPSLIATTPFIFLPLPSHLMVMLTAPSSATDLVLAAQELGSLARNLRSEEHTSELQSLMRISYAVFCLKKKKKPCNILTRFRLE